MEEDVATLSAPRSELLLTKYEQARLVSARVKELELNLSPTVPLEPGDTLFDIAAREIDNRTLEFELKRILPGGTVEIWPLSAFPKKNI